MQVLLVEDNPGDQRLIRECFKDNPYQHSFEIINCSRLSQVIPYFNGPDKKK